MGKMLVVLACTGLAPGLLSAQTAQEAVATIDGAPFLEGDFRKDVGNKLAIIENQAYEQKERLLLDAIDKRLLDKEAAARKLTVPALEKAEIEDKLPPVTPEEIATVREDNKERLVGVPEDKATQAITDAIVQQHRSNRRTAFVHELREKARVRILLDPPRVVIPEADTPYLGPKEAPVTIVEFSDFQCPYCAQALPIVRQVREEYGDRVRLVFRDFPLSIHANAAKDAEAGACAREQGHFWEMHDRLFADQQHQGVDDLKASAKAMGLDTQAFDTCLDSNRYQAMWQAATKEAEGYGVSGTPFFFVNGRILNGVVPYATFKRVIDEELDRAAPAKGAAAGARPASSKP
jgi:protein-disulfide isomerase